VEELGLINKYSIIFDMDGVLVDSEPVIEAAAIAGLKEYGVPAKPQDFIPFIGAGEDKYIGGVAEKYGVPYKLEMKARVYQIYLELVPLKLKVYDGIIELLNKWHSEGIKMALASSADRIKIEANLRVAGIPPSLFSSIISGEDVKNKKPSPDIYLMAANRIGTNPQECIVIEDALNGIQAAKAAGMKCAAVATSFPKSALEKENPDLIYDKISDADKMLRNFM
jgi:HAD superfamily hydrolase (TIGR01509 family)